MDSLAPDQIHDLIARVIAANGTEQRRARRSLIEAPRDAVIPTLVNILMDAKARRPFERIAHLLAELGGDEAVEALAHQARTQRRYPGLAMRALAKCDHPQVAPVILDLLMNGKFKQRRAAALALARTYTALAIERCFEAANSQATVRRALLAALRETGRADKLARRVLRQPALSTAERVRAICGLAALPLSLLPFNPQRFLDREAANARSREQSEARAAADLLRAQTTLLRPSEYRDDTKLLRAASGPGATDGDTLLRAADIPDDEEDHLPREATGWRGWWSRFVRAVRGNEPL